MSTRSFSEGTDLGFAHGLLSTVNSQRLLGASSRTVRMGANCSKTRRTEWAVWGLKECKRTQFGPEKARRAKEFLVCLGVRRNSLRGVNADAGCDI